MTCGWPEQCAAGGACEPSPDDDADAVRLVEDVMSATSDVRVGTCHVPTARTAPAIVAALREAGWAPAP